MEPAFCAGGGLLFLAAGPSGAPGSSSSSVVAPPPLPAPPAAAAAAERPPPQVVWWTPRSAVAPHGAWPLRVAADTVSGGDDDASLSQEERLRRQRLRQRSTGITAFQAAGGRLFFVQRGDLFSAAIPAGADARDAEGGAASCCVVRHDAVRRLAGLEEPAPAAAAAAGPVFGARVSPCARWVAFVQDRALFVASAGGDGRVLRLSPDPAAAVGGGGACGAVAYGLPDYLSEEEFARHTGFWWSPDSRFLLYQRTDEAAVDEVDGEGHVLRSGGGGGGGGGDAAAQLPTAPSRDVVAGPDAAAAATAGSSSEHHRYPYAGTRNPSLSFFLADVSALGSSGGESRLRPEAHARLAICGEAADVYVPRVQWLPGSDGVLLQVLNRQQDVLDLVRFAVPPAAATAAAAAAAAAAGASASSPPDLPGELLLRECAHGGWLNVTDTCTPLRRGSADARDFIVWGSERSGACHLYLYSAPRAGAAASAVAYAGPPRSADGIGDAAAAVCAAAGCGAARLERAITAGRWAVDAIAHVTPTAADAAAASSPDALVFFHARAHGPTEVHLYAAPVFTWASVAAPVEAPGEEALWAALLPRPPAPAAAAAAAVADTAPLLAAAAAAAAAADGGVVAAAEGWEAAEDAELAAPPLWFEAAELSSTPEALCARVLAARAFAARAERRRFLALGMLRLTAGPGLHHCTLADDGSAFVDELSSMYEARPSLTLYSLDARCWPAARARGWSSAAAAGGLFAAFASASELEVARRLVLEPPPGQTAAATAAAAAGATAAATVAADEVVLPTAAIDAAPAADDVIDKTRPAVVLDRLAVDAAVAAAAAAPAPAASYYSRDCCTGGLFDHLFAATSSSSLSPTAAAAPASSTAAPLPLLAAPPSPRARLLARLLPYEAAGRHASSGGGSGDDSSLAGRALGVRAEAVIAGLLPHPYAPTERFVRSAGALLGGAAGAELLRLAAAATTTTAAAKAAALASALAASAAPPPPAPGLAADARSSAGAASAAPSSFERLCSFVQQQLGLGSGAADDASSADDNAASGVPPRWPHAVLLALLFPPAALPAAPPLPGALETRVAMRRTPFPPTGCFAPSLVGASPPTPPADAADAAIGGAAATPASPRAVAAAAASAAAAAAPPPAPLPPPAVLVLDTADAPGDAAAGDERVRRLLRCPFRDDDARMYASVTLPLSPPPASPRAAAAAAAALPSVLYVYGGPGVQIVSNGLGLLTGGNSYSAALCAAGIAVARMDNRGSAHRGVAWERAVWRRLGAAEVADQAAGLAQLVRSGLLDARRVGVHGWSYGGFMTLRLLAARLPFAAGVAGAPVTSWRLYDTAYTERYMRAPADNADGYAATSLLAPAAAGDGGGGGGGGADALLGLRFRVLHGDTDENVHVVNSRCLQAAWTDALQRRIASRSGAIIPTDEHFVFLRGERHALSEAAGDAARRETVRYLIEHVLHGGGGARAATAAGV